MTGLQQRNTRLTIVRNASICILALGTGLAHAASRKVPKPPPGSIPGTIECDVGTSNDAVSYARDHGCLLGNVTLSCMSDAEPDLAWTVSVARTANELARLASTASEAPEAPYLSAVELSLLPLRMGVASQALAEKLCSHATTAAESACFAYYCSTTEVRTASAELNEATLGLKNHCAREAECTPKQRGLDPVHCHGTWTEAQKQLGRAVAAYAIVEAGTAYSADTQQIVQQWMQRATELAKNAETAIRADQPSNVEQLATFVAEQNAIPALSAMRTDEIRTANAIVEDLQAKYQPLICPRGASACRLDRKEKLAAATLIEASVDHKATEVEKALTEKISVDMKIDVLQQPLDLPNPLSFEAPKDAFRRLDGSEGLR